LIADRIATVRRCLTDCLCMGQFACLLPTLVVVAVSQAPSPKSNPDSSLPVKATVVQYTTVELIGQKLLRSSRGGRSPREGETTRHGNLPTLRPRRASLSQPRQHTGLYTAAGLCISWAFIRHHRLDRAPRGANPTRENPSKSPTPSVAWLTWFERVLATRFWWMSKGVPHIAQLTEHTLSRR